jgi:hypothetical protein
LGPGDTRPWPRCSVGSPAYVKPFIKRQKNDAADAEGVAEAARKFDELFKDVTNHKTSAPAMAAEAYSE